MPNVRPRNFAAWSVCALATASGCGSQITHLRGLAQAAFGASGVPPALQALAIDEATPTRDFPLELDWQGADGTHAQYCLLENSFDRDLCVWQSGALPATYPDSGADGPVQVTAYLRNAYGVSAPIFSNTVVIDRTPPALASANVTNADPTNSTSLALAYGAVTGGTYSDYCVGVNDASAAACAWVAGTLPASATVPATDGPQILWIRLRDDAGNVSAPVATPAIVYDGTGPAIAVASPNGAETWAGGSAHAITWTATDPAGVAANSVALHYTTDGTTWTAIAAGEANDGTYAWTVPAIDSATVRVRVTATDGAGNSANDASNVVFAIDSAGPTVAVASPNGAEAWAGGSAHAITWTATDAAGVAANSVALHYTTDGTTWTAIATGEANDGTYAWTVPAIDSTTVRVRVTAVDAVGNSGSDASDAVFAIDSTAPAVAATAPNGGEIWAGGSSHAITWTASDAGGLATNPIALHYTTDGTTWTAIASGEANDGTYAWTVPAINSATVRVRATAVDAVGNSGSDASDAVFTIDSTAPTLASLTVTNANPTDTRTFALAWGAIGGTYASHCILANDTAVANCAWTAGAVPASFDVAATPGAYVLSAWLRDAAGNVSAIATAGSVTYTPRPILLSKNLFGVPGGTATVSWNDAEFANTDLQVRFVDSASRVAHTSAINGADEVTLPARAGVYRVELRHLGTGWLSYGSATVNQTQTGFTTVNALGMPVVGNYSAWPSVSGATADLDGDGTEDFLFASGTNSGGTAVGPGLYFYKYDALGTAQLVAWGTTHPFNASATGAVRAVVPADFNGDGYVDHAFSHQGANGQICVYLGSAVSVWASGGCVTLPDGANGRRDVYRMLAYDVDLDGDLDLAALGGQHNAANSAILTRTITILKNDGAGAFTEDVVRSLASTAPFYSAVLMDLNDDRFLDIAGWGGSNALAIAYGTATGLGALANVSPASYSHTIGVGNVVHSAYLNGDRYPDLAIVSNAQSMGGTRLYWDPVNSVYSSATFIWDVMEQLSGRLVFADLGHTGTPDYFFGLRNRALFANRGGVFRRSNAQIGAGGTVNAATTYTGITAEASWVETSHWMPDFDGDGKIDILHMRAAGAGMLEFWRGN